MSRRPKAEDRDFKNAVTRLPPGNYTLTITDDVMSAPVKPEGGLIWSDTYRRLTFSRSKLIGFPELKPGDYTAEEGEMIEAAMVAARKTRNADGLLTMWSLPPAIALAIVRMLKPGAWKAEKKAMMERLDRRAS